MLKWRTEWKQIWRTKCNKNVKNIPDGQIVTSTYACYEKKKKLLIMSNNEDKATTEIKKAHLAKPQKKKKKLTNMDSNIKAEIHEIKGKCTVENMEET